MMTLLAVLCLLFGGSTLTLLGALYLLWRYVRLEMQRSRFASRTDAIALQGAIYRAVTAAAEVVAEKKTRHVR